MKALIRNKGETVTEVMGIPGIDWDNGMPLTNPAWAGGPYILVSDYVPEDPPDPALAVAAQDPTAKDHAQDTIIIDGVAYIRMT